MPAAYGNRQVGTLNPAGEVAGAPLEALVNVVAYAITQLFQRKGLMSDTPFSMTALQGSAGTITGNTITVPFLDPTTNNKFEVEAKITLANDNDNKHELATEVQDGPAALTEVHEAQAAALTDDQLYLFNELESAQKTLNTTNIEGKNYVVPEVANEVYELFASVIKKEVKGMDSLIDQVQSLIITSYVNTKFNHLTPEDKTRLIEESRNIFSQHIRSDFNNVGMTILVPDEFAHTYTEIGDLLLSMITNDKNMFTDHNYTRTEPGQPGFSINLAFINLYETLVNIIKAVAKQLKYSEAALDSLGGGSRQNKGMFNYAHFIPLRNRSKKHNYATKIKPNSRHRRRNKTSNKRRSRRS
jgi:hypothetical protein